MCPLGLFGRCFSDDCLMLCRSRNAFGIQLFGNLSAGLSCNDFQEDPANNRSCLLVDDHLVLLRRMSLIAIRDAAHILCLALLHTHCRFDLLREVFAVIIINEVFERNVHTDGLAFMLCAVIVVIDGYEADAEEREDMLQIVTYLKVVSSETGEVFDNDATDLALLSVLYHTHKVRTIKVCAGETVIKELNTRKIAEHGILV